MWDCKHRRSEDDSCKRKRRSVIKDQKIKEGQESKIVSKDLQINVNDQSL